MSTALRVVLPFAFGYFISYCFRNINAVIAPDLTAELALDAGALGGLTAAYFFSFAAIQLPLGLMLDRFGPRRVESVLLVVAAVGALMFSLATSVPGLVLARAIIGMGVAACLMGAFKATTLWFSSARQPLMNGIITAFGGLGAVAATAPVEAALGLTDWRGVFQGLCVLTLVVAAILYFVVPKRPEESAATTLSLGQLLAGIGTVLGNRRYRRIGPMVIANGGAFVAIQGLWAGPWLSDVAGLGREAVAAHLFYIALAMVAGFLGLGLIAERLARVGVSTLLVAGTSSLITIVLTAIIAFAPPSQPLLVWLPFGFFGTCATVFFPPLTQSFPVALSGRAITTLNVGVFGAAFAIQWGLGEILGHYALDKGGYSVDGYAMAFGVAIVVQVVAFLWLVSSRRALALS